MSPKEASSNIAVRTKAPPARRGRPPFPRELVLAAADDLFSDRADLQSVSMDDIAAAAGVGKGTLFRAFGSRDGLLDALFTLRLASVREAIEREEPPFASDPHPRAQIFAILDRLLSFKLENRHLIRAREVSGRGLLQSAPYRWMQGTLSSLIERNGSAAGEDAGYLAHILLGGLRADLIDELIESGLSPREIRSAQAALAGRLLD